MREQAGQPQLPACALASAASPHGLAWLGLWVMNVVFKDKFRSEAVPIGDTEVCVALLIEVYSLSLGQTCGIYAVLPYLSA